MRITVRYSILTDITDRGLLIVGYRTLHLISFTSGCFLIYIQGASRNAEFCTQKILSFSFWGGGGS